MSDNPHHAYAEAAFSSANAGAEPEFNEAVRADALIQATLALAYEQRTANLIALWGMSDDACMALDTASGTSESAWSSVAKQITERLGLS